MLLTSTFRWTLLFMPALLLAITAILFVLGRSLADGSAPSNGIWVPFLMLLFTWAWILFNELRLKATRLRIDDRHITISGFFGLGPARTYRFADLQGVRTGSAESRTGTYEYLFFIRRDKTGPSISTFYHSNYAELKQVLYARLPNLGHRDLGLLDELRATCRRWH